MSDEEIASILSERISAIRERIAAACNRAGRSVSEVTLIAVSKTVSPRVAGLLPTLDVLDLGEGRPQELWRKADSLKALPIRWHMIGHFQRNKVERTLPLTHCIHSVDSERLLDEIVKEASKQNLRPKILLQVNASHEEQKHGFDADGLVALTPKLASLPLEVCGLMGMAAISENPDDARPAFRELRQLRDRLRQSLPQLSELSMGMSGDFEIAIEESSTFVRVGSTIFEGLEGE